MHLVTLPPGRCHLLHHLCLVNRRLGTLRPPLEDGLRHLLSMLTSLLHSVPGDLLLQQLLVALSLLLLSFQGLLVEEQQATMPLQRHPQLTSLGELAGGLLDDLLRRLLHGNALVVASRTTLWTAFPLGSDMLVLSWAFLLSYSYSRLSKATPWACLL